MLFSITAVQLYNFSGDFKTTSISSNQTATHIVPNIMVFNNFWIIAGTVCNPTAVCYTKMNHDICLLSGFHCMKSHSLLAGRLWLCLVLRSGFHCLRYQADHSVPFGFLVTTIGAAQAKNETDDKKPCFLKRWSSASIFVNHAHVTGFFTVTLG